MKTILRYSCSALTGRAVKVKCYRLVEANRRQVWFFSNSFTRRRICFSSSSWFPKGKHDKPFDPLICNIRERRLMQVFPWKAYLLNIFRCFWLQERNICGTSAKRIWLLNFGDWPSFITILHREKTRRIKSVISGTVPDPLTEVIP